MSNNDPPTYGLTYPDNYISSLPTAPGARTPLLPLADFIQDGLRTGCNGLNPSLVSPASLTSG